MVIQHKLKATVACACLVVLVIFSLIGVIILTTKLIKPGPPSTPEEYAKRHPEKSYKLYQKEVDDETRSERVERNYQTAGLVYLLIALCLRPLAIWKLWESLRMCEDNPKQALKALEISLKFEVAICIWAGLWLVFAPFAFFELIFIYYGLYKFRGGLRTEVGGGGDATLMKAPVGNDGRPVAVISSEVYPPPSNQVSDTNKENQS